MENTQECVVLWIRGLRIFGGALCTLHNIWAELVGTKRADQSPEMFLFLFFILAFRGAAVILQIHVIERKLGAMCRRALNR